MMSTKEAEAWISFKQLVQYDDTNYELVRAYMIDQFKTMSCLISVKAHFLHNHLDLFSENLADLCEQQGELLHQDIKVMEKG